MAFWGSNQSRKHSEEVKAQSQAIWIARTWSEGISMDELCRVAAEEGKVTILRDEWDAGGGDDLALRPVVSGRRICVPRDRSVHWKPAK